jgi:hypothetical protein
MVPEDRGSRFLKHILHQFPQEHCLKMTTVSIACNNKAIVCFIRGVKRYKGELGGGG